MGDATAVVGKAPGPGLPGRPDGLFRAVPALLHTPSHHRHKDSLTPQRCSHNLGAVVACNCLQAEADSL